MPYGATHPQSYYDPQNAYGAPEGSWATAPIVSAPGAFLDRNQQAAYARFVTPMMTGNTAWDAWLRAQYSQLADTFGAAQSQNPNLAFLDPSGNRRSYMGDDITAELMRERFLAQTPRRGARTPRPRRRPCPVVPEFLDGLLRRHDDESPGAMLGMGAPVGATPGRVSPSELGEFATAPIGDPGGVLNMPRVRPPQPPFGNPPEVAAGRYDLGQPGRSNAYGSWMAGRPDPFAPSAFQPPPSVGGQPGTGGGMASLGGDWAGVDRWDATIQAAAAKHGVPANLIKAVMKLESGGNPDSVSVAGATGLMQIMPFWNGTAGYNIHDPTQNIMLGAHILKQNYKLGNPNNPGEKSWEWATRRYLGLGGPDAYGTTHDDYWDGSAQDWQPAQPASGGSGAAPQPIGGAWGGNPVGNAIVAEAVKFQGVPYIWGSLPGPNQDPWQTGWDCSAFVNWLDDKYGNNEIPAGSHYQYQHAVDTGKLFRDQGQLRPGDLVFMDTGGRAGGGAGLNSASHVAMYIGNGQIIHAANPSVGTIISQWSGYYADRFIGAMHMGWSGGSPAGGGGFTAPTAQQSQRSTIRSPIDFLLDPNLRW